MLDVEELLVRRGLISRDQLEQARAVRRKVGGGLPSIIAELGYAGEEQLVKFLGQALGLPFARAEVLDDVPPEVRATLTPELAERYRAVPIAVRGSEVQVGVADPDRLEQMEELGRVLGRAVRPALVTESALAEALDRYYRIRPELRVSRVPDKMRTTDRQMQAVDREVERTGITRIPTGLHLVGPPSALLRDVSEDLVAANSIPELVAPIFRFFAEIFSEVAVLGFHKRSAHVLAVGDSAGARRLSIPLQIPINRDTIIWSLLVRPQVHHRTTVSRTSDPISAQLCEALGIPAVELTLIPVFDGGRPVFLVIGQGRTESEIHAAFPSVKEFVEKVGKAFRLVALKRELREQSSG